MEKRPIRQGDVLLVPVDEREIPAAATKAKRDRGRLIVAYGEVTGHAHEIVGAGSLLVIDGKPVRKDKPLSDDDAVKLTVAEGATFVKLMKKAQLVHEEHAPIDLAPGTYRYVPQVEHSPWGERRVLD